MSDDPSFEEISERIRLRQEAAQQQARETLVVTCNRLAELGVTLVSIEYDGYGDEGTVSSIVAYQGEEEFPLSADITRALDDAACEFLPAGWEINDGSFGELVLDIANRTITRQHNWRVTETEYEEEEFDL